MTIGPTAIMALMTQEPVSTYNSDAAVLLCFLSGCVIFLLGVLHLGTYELLQFYVLGQTHTCGCLAALHSHTDFNRMENSPAVCNRR